MKFIFSTSLFCFLGFSFSLSASPELSKAMIELFEKQSSRIQAGDESLEELLSDLDEQASADDPVAQFFYATMGASGEGYDAKNRRYLKRSASNGCAGAAGILSILFLSQSNHKEGLMWMKRAARNGDASSQFSLGKYYLGGRFGLPMDEIEGASWILLAKDQSFSKVISALIEIDIAGMARLFSKAEVANRYSSLKKQISIFPKHPCGQSVL